MLEEYVNQTVISGPWKTLCQKQVSYTSRNLLSYRPLINTVLEQACIWHGWSEQSYLLVFV